MARCLASLLDRLGWAQWEENELDLEEKGMVNEESGDSASETSVGAGVPQRKGRKRRVPMGVTMLSHSK